MAEAGKQILIAPKFYGYQLLGDSQLLRFATTSLGMAKQRCGDLSHIGLCVSGQSIRDLKNRIRINLYPVSNKVILLIGTNNLKQGIPVEQMIDDVIDLLEILREKAKEIVLLTVPPLPRYANREEVWKNLEKFNTFLSDYAKVEEGSGVVVADICSLFVANKRFIRLDCFEQTFPDGRLDLIHLNGRAFELISSFLLEGEYLKKAERD